jgi:hypothetical protein
MAQSQDSLAVRDAAMPECGNSAEAAAKLDAVRELAQHIVSVPEELVTADSLSKLHNLVDARPPSARLLAELAKLDEACALNLVPDRRTAVIEDKAPLRRAVVEAPALPRLVQLLQAPDPDVASFAMLLLGGLADAGTAAGIVAAGAAPPLMAAVQGEAMRGSGLAVLAVRALAAGQGATFEQLVAPLLAMLQPHACPMKSIVAALVLLEMHGSIAGSQQRMAEVAAAATRRLLEVCALECARHLPLPFPGREGVEPPAAGEAEEQGAARAVVVLLEPFSWLVQETLAAQSHSRAVADALASQTGCLRDLLAMLEPSYAVTSRQAASYAWAAAYALLVLVDTSFHGLRLDEQLAADPRVLAPLVRLLQAKGWSGGTPDLMTE